MLRRLLTETTLPKGAQGAIFFIPFLRGHYPVRWVIRVRLADLPTVPLLAGQSRFFTRCPASRKIMEMSRFLYEVGFFFARAQFVTLPRCPDVNANHPMERNYGTSVRFLAKIPNGTAAESPCYSVFWNAIDFCRL